MIPIAKPLMGEAEVEAARRVILSGWITQGPEVAAFEREFRDFVGAAHACAVSNCTTALHLALLAVGVRPGDEVITVSHSYIATANAVRYCGAMPVFVDIEPDTFNLDPSAMEQAFSSRTKAVLCVHQMGMPCDLGRILRIARRHGVAVVEDAACAIGSEIQWEGRWDRIGRPHGDIACFSFHPRKIVSTGDGGMITTSRPEWDQRLRLLRQHAMSVPDTVRHGANQVIFESYPEVGFNYRMTDIQAAIGLVQLGRLDAIVPRRRQLAEAYRSQLSDLPLAGMVADPPHGRTNYQSFWIELADDFARTRDELLQALLDQGISARRGIMASHLEPAYADTPRVPLPITERVTQQSLILPLFHEMTEGQHDRVVAAVRAAAGSA
jgi:dTDP-4-amino-4,6-dideoxygalactose transaminase